MAEGKLKLVRNLFARHREISVALILGLEIFIFYLLLREPGRAHSFINGDNFLMIFKYSGIYGIAAIGASMIIISGGIDLSPGAVIALTTVVTGHLFVESNLPLPLAALLGFLVGLGTGLLAAFLVTIIKLPPFIATLGVMGVARGLAFIITKGGFYDLSQKIPEHFSLLHLPIEYWPGTMMVALAVIFHLFMVYTRWGRQVHAVGGNETASYFSGVKVRRIKFFVYLCGGLFASLSGVILCIVHGQGRADVASGYELDIIAASVVGGASLSGGKGSVLGAVLGSLIFGVLRNGLSQVTGLTFYERLIVGVVVVVIVIIDQLTVRKENKI
jgi:ribose transport system permease protein